MSLSASTIVREGNNRISDMNTKGKKNKIPRPLNAFMLFANDRRASFRKDHPGETNSRISVRLGEAWKKLNGKDKTKYYQLSKKAEIEHRNKYPDYIYCPKDARHNKKSRRKATTNSSDGKPACENQQATLSTRSTCPEMPRNVSGTHGSDEWNPSHRVGGKKFSQSGQGDQVRHCSIPFGPTHYQPPFPYPRFNCWDFRAHPYMSAPYGRMSFFPPMMYPYGPQPVSFQSQTQPNQFSDQESTNYQPPTEPSEVFSQAAVKEHPKAEPLTGSSSDPQRCMTSHTTPIGNEAVSTNPHQQQIGTENVGVSHVSTETKPQVCSDGRQPGQFQNSASSMMRFQYPDGIQNPQQQYTYLFTEQKPAPFTQISENKPPTKTFADLSNGKAEIVSVIEPQLQSTLVQQSRPI